jgi:hypothetical protein
MLPETFQRRLLAHKHLFVGRENRPTLIIQFQLFAVASRDGFLGNTKRRRAHDRVNA